MADEKHQFFTSVGRFVYGDLTTKRDKDGQNRPIDPDKQRFEFGLAIRKDDPGVIPLIQGIAGYAYNAYATRAPHIAQRIGNWMQTFDGFSMKISDGDKPNSRGQVNPNTQGCYVFWFSTAIDIIGASAAHANAQIPLDQIKRGYYVDVAGSAAINGLTDNNAGVYLNPTVVRLVAIGDEIVGSVDPQALFANHAAPVNLPPGARPIGSAPQPPAGAGMPGAGLPGIGMPGNAPAAAPAMPMGAPAPQPTTAQPQAGFGAPNGGFTPPATGAPAGMPPAAPAGMPPFVVAGAVNPTASLGNPGFPAHPGILGVPQQ